MATISFDPFDGAALADPYPEFACLRDRQTYEFTPIIGFRGPRALHVEWDYCPSSGDGRLDR